MPPITISCIIGKTVFDSRKVPTLSVTVEGSDGSRGTFSVPSGASKGAHEAHELRDNDTPHGGVIRALDLLETEIAPALIGKKLLAQEEIDELLISLDGTSNKEHLGGNTLIGVSIAVAKAAAASQKKEVWQYLHDTYWNNQKPAFPRLYANLINGGKHAETALAFQEYHVVPKTTNMKEASALVASIQEKLGRNIEKKFGHVNTGDEGGYALPVTDVEEPLALLQEAVVSLGVEDNVEFALDVAASSFFDTDKNTYVIDGIEYGIADLESLYEKLSTSYKLLSLEDPFSENDFASFAKLSNHLGGVLCVGDDLTTTNKERLLRAASERSVNALIIKPNQIGTLTETIATMKCAEQSGIKCIVSHRSGETCDDFIADLAYASSVFGIKLGAHGPKEREAKYSRLLTIEKEL